MDNFREDFKSRRYLSYVSIMGTTQIHLRNPGIVALWSVAFPGFGHLLLNKYLRGYSLFVWEMFINQKIHLNQAIVHTFNGNIQAARDILDVRFMSLYIPVYLFAIWDSYRTTVDLNKIHVLAKREDSPNNMFSIGALEINYLDKRSPWIALVWSMCIPSLGQLYVHRIVLAAFTLVMTVVIINFSHLVEGIHYLIVGDIRTSSAVLDAQWALYYPSLYCFTIFDAYVATVENNKLFDAEQKRFLIRNYQKKRLNFTKGSMTN